MFDIGLEQTGVETLCRNQDSCFRLKTTGNTGIPDINVRKKQEEYILPVYLFRKFKVKVTVVTRMPVFLVVFR